MKYNIQKLQSGGLIFNYIPSTGSEPAVAPTGAASSKGAKQEELLDEDIYKELMEKGGLTSDVNAFTNSILLLQSSPSNFLKPGGVSNTLRLIAQVNQIKDNKKAWEEAYASAKATEGLGEVAVGAFGEVYVRDKNTGIKAISLKDLEANRGKYSPLSVSELLTARRVEENLAFNSKIFTVAENSVGINKILSKIKDVVLSIGKTSEGVTTYEDSRELKRMIEKKTGMPLNDQQLEGIRKINSIGSGPEGIYKITQKTKQGDAQINEALNYLWASLRPEEKNKLTANYILGGGKGANTSNIIKSAVLSFYSPESEIQADYQADASKAAGFTTDKEKPITNFELSHNGKLGKSSFAINKPSTNKKMNVTATSVWRLSTVNGDPIGPKSADFIVNGENGAPLDISKAQFGNRDISTVDFSKIIYDGDNAARAYFPVYEDGKINYTRLEEFKKTEEEIAKKYKFPQDIGLINAEFEKKGFNVIVQEDGTYADTGTVKPFLVFYGYTAEEAPFVSDNSMVEALQGEEENKARELTDKVWKEEKLENVPTGWFDWSTTYYKGMVSIPYKENSSAIVSAVAGNLLSNQTSVTDYRVKKQLQAADHSINADLSKLGKNNE